MTWARPVPTQFLTSASLALKPLYQTSPKSEDMRMSSVKVRPETSKQDIKLPLT